LFARSVPCIGVRHGRNSIKATRAILPPHQNPNFEIKVFHLDASKGTPNAPRRSANPNRYRDNRVHVPFSDCERRQQKRL
jgi:hypothetical protein